MYYLLVWRSEGPNGFHLAKINRGRVAFLLGFRGRRGFLASSHFRSLPTFLGLQPAHPSSKSASWALQISLRLRNSSVPLIRNLGQPNFLKVSPTFLKFPLGHLAFMKDSHTKRNPFSFLRKKGRSKITSSVCFAASTGAVSGPAGPLPGTELSTPASSHQRSGLCEHLCFISIYFVLPLARCVLRSQCL